MIRLGQTEVNVEGCWCCWCGGQLLFSISCPMAVQRSATPPLLCFESAASARPVRESMAKEHHAAPPSPSIPTNTLQDAWPRFDAQRVPGANETQRGGGEITDATYQGLPSAAPRASGIRGRPWLSVYHEMEDGTYFCLFITRVSISVFSFCVHVFIFRSHIYQFYVEPRKAGIYLKVVIPLFFVIRMQQTNIG